MALFVGDSIREGDCLPKAPPAFCVDWLRQRAPGLHFFFSNQGKSGHTTVDILPVTNIDFPQIEKAAAQLQAEHQGRLIFSVMLGTNDSAIGRYAWRAPLTGVLSLEFGDDHGSPSRRLSWMHRHSEPTPLVQP